MARTCEKHGHAMLVRGLDDFVITNGPTGLNDHTDTVFGGNIERASVAGCELHRFRLVSALPDRTDGVNDVFGRQVVTLR